jgi:hypothetical protein
MWSRLGFSGAAVARRFGDTSAYRSFGGWWLVWRRGGAVRQRWGRLGCGRWVGGGRGAGGRGGADDRRKKLRGGATQPEEEETIVEGKEESEDTEYGEEESKDTEGVARCPYYTTGTLFFSSIQ